MTETYDPARVRVRIAQDLTAIEDMFARLRAEAVNRAGDPDIPGGAAMVMLGPGADVEAFGYAQLSELMGRTNGMTEVALSSDIEPPLSFLASWVDVVREARGQEPTERKARIAREVEYLRSALDWMLAVNDDGEPWFIEVDDFAEQLHRVRRAMENVLREGERAERINARCAHCEQSPRLVLRRGEAEDGSGDHWQCPNRDCRHLYDVDGVKRCWRQMLVRRGDAPEWVSIKQAASALSRSPWTIRDWVNREKVAAREVDGVLHVHWAETRAQDDTTRRRGRRRHLA